MISIREITQVDAEYVLHAINFKFNVGGRMARECAIAFFMQAQTDWHGANSNLSPDVSLDLMAWAAEKGYTIPTPKNETDDKGIQ